MRYQLSDLRSLTSLGNLHFLLVMNKNAGTPSTRCCQVSLSKKKCFFFDNIETVLRFKPYEEVPEKEWEFFRKCQMIKL